ncbi:MAG: phospho-sugar mutase [Gemmatimonadetes bacterium]|nr:phospho-sugar mutase [Gemmatimonadota bacterium]MYB62043.1 phospho-sugar mutase [Gemmatimonadota bacterium]
MNAQAVQKINAWIGDGTLSRTAGEAIVQWLDDPACDAFAGEIRALVDTGNTGELEDAFGTSIAFGTGGMRGRMGPGPNRFNTLTVGGAAQGLARYLLREDGPKGWYTRSLGGRTGAGVVVAWDTRHNSETFAKETARVLAANGVPVLIFDGYRSTPALSFAVRDQQAAAGVVISASHNPPVDNGFKVYGPDGGQVVAPHDEGITGEMRRAEEIRRIPFDEGIERGLIRTVDPQVDARYGAVLSDLSLDDARDVQVVYTPLHGVGMTSVAAALEELGYQDVHYVDEQVVPDGAFPTLEGGIANPEKPSAFKLGIRKAAENGADLVLASDPDADRVGCALPLPDRGWEAAEEDLVLNGHQIGVLLCHYVLSRKQAAGTLPPRGLFCKTAVTSDLAAIIARSCGLEVVDDLPVGFKHVGAAIDRMPADMTFVFGTEESHGYLADARLRDKEAATGILLAEYAARAKRENRTLRDELDDIHRRYGYFREVQRSVALPGTEGTRRIVDLMAALRAKPPRQIGGRAVCRVIDRLSGQSRDLRTGTTGPVAGERVNILVFTFSEAGHTRVIVRPSGTEPTIKYYVSASSVDMDGTRGLIDSLAESVLDAIIEWCEGV